MNTKKKFKTKRIKQPEITVKNQIQDFFLSDTSYFIHKENKIVLRLNSPTKNLDTPQSFSTKHLKAMITMTPFNAIIETITHESLHSLLTQFINDHTSRALDILVDLPNFNSLEYGF